jgi:uncharacterized protein (DUF2147 family)
MNNNLLRVSLLIIYASLFSVTYGFAQKADDITGFWWNAEKDAKIEIYKKGDKYFGKIVELTEPTDNSGKPKTDTENEVAKYRNRPILGLVIISDLQWEEDHEYENGEIYDPNSGKTYSLSAELKGDQLNLRGYIGFSLIGRTTIWTRVR